MTPEALWQRYAATWSLGADARAAEFAMCLGNEVTYCDPNGTVEGCSALSNYMDDFQQNVPGGRFVIQSVLHHHDRSLAHWTLQGPDGTPLQTGTSHAVLSKDGRLQAISGFFDAASKGSPA
jgi:hypothetical protein